MSNKILEVAGNIDLTATSQDSQGLYLYFVIFVDDPARSSWHSVSIKLLRAERSGFEACSWTLLLPFFVHPALNEYRA